MPGCLDTVITNHLDNRLLPAMSYCGDGCKGQSTCSRECQSYLSSLTFMREGERRGTRKDCSTCAQKHSCILWETLPESCHVPGLQVTGYSYEETYTQPTVSSQVICNKVTCKIKSPREHTTFQKHTSPATLTRVGPGHRGERA